MAILLLHMRRRLYIDAAQPGVISLNISVFLLLSLFSHACVAACIIIHPLVIVSVSSSIMAFVFGILILRYFLNGRDLVALVALLVVHVELLRR